MSLKTFARASIDLRKSRKVIAELLKAHNVGYGEFEILYLLKDKQLTQPSHIVAELSHDSAAVSRILSNLHLNNYISYNNDVLDRRRVFVQITDDGEELINTLLEEVVPKSPASSQVNH